MKKEKILQKFIEKSKNVHGDKYDYSKVEYENSTTPVCIICPEHGEFLQAPVVHAKGSGCPKCANRKRGDTFRWTTEKFIKESQKVHGNKYDYSRVKFENTNTDVCIVCPEHGEFWQKPNNHLQGQGCPKCSHRGLSKEEMVSEFRKVHGDKYQYDVETIGKMNDKCRMICPEHGEFWQSPTKHLRGQGCPKCKHPFLTKEEFVERANKIHNGKYDYTDSVYQGYGTLIEIRCPIHGVFTQNINNHLQGCGCPKCGNIISEGEEEISSFLQNECECEIKTRVRNIISPYEIDIYLSQRNIGIEYDGLRWHNEEHRPDKNYHLVKTVKCKDCGIRLIHIFEDEWLFKKDIVKSRIMNILGMTKRKLFARKCEIREVENNMCSDFLNQNHIQGKCISKYRYGLYFNGELVSVMTFGLMRKNVNGKQREGCFELLRFCNKLNTTVVGGASKLLNHFINVVNPSEIVSYCDRRWSNGELYERLGFKHDHDSSPSYFYIIGNKRENRFAYRKDVLVEKYGCPRDMSEHDFCQSKGWYRIYDCGTKVYIWKKQ